jgi:alpha-beta hydrolase superfamily lysophospholipase
MKRGMRGPRDREGLVGEGDPSPIAIDGRSPAVLAFHGFGGTPHEVGLVAGVASELGLSARAPLLPGHGTSVADLAGRRWPDWVDAAETALEAATSDGSRAVVSGLSLGSLLAAHLAATRPERVVALILLANAAWLAAPSSWGLPHPIASGCATSGFRSSPATLLTLCAQESPDHRRAADSRRNLGAACRAIVREELPACAVLR